MLTLAPCALLLLLYSSYTSLALVLVYESETTRAILGSVILESLSPYGKQPALSAC